MNSKQQKEEIDKFYRLLDRGAKAIGLKIRKDQYPRIEVGNEPDYDPLEHKITLPEEYLNSGNILGEYLGHALRDISNKQRESPKLGYTTGLLNLLGFKPKLPQSQPEKRDIEVDEFFGYLGRFLAKDITKPQDNLDFKQRTPYEMREQHQEPYEHAKELKPEEIDYKALFKMPNRKIRKKYFRKSQPLEKLVQLILPTSAILTLILITKNITGYVVQNNSQQTPPLQILLIIFLLVLLYKNQINSKLSS